jgi:dihydrofolate reductase
MRMTIIAAMDDNRLIGTNNDLPWRIPADLKHFKATTTGGVMVMGANTWRSFGGRALPKRISIVVTRHPEAIEVREEDRCNVLVLSCMELALTVAKAYAADQGHEEYFVIGGANIYEQLIDRADRMVLTRVHGTHAGDKYFPEIGDNWVAEIYNGLELVEDNGFTFTVLDYRRP